MGQVKEGKKLARVGKQAQAPNAVASSWLRALCGNGAITLEKKACDPSHGQKENEQNHRQWFRDLTPQVNGRDDAVRSQGHGEEHDVPGRDSLLLELCGKHHI